MLYMDGHGIYVWSAYAITIFVLSAILLLPRRRQARFFKQLAGEVRRQQGSQRNPVEES